jgi:hypothetical protein
MFSILASGRRDGAKLHKGCMIGERKSRRKMDPAIFAIRAAGRPRQQASRLAQVERLAAPGCRAGLKCYKNAGEWGRPQTCIQRRSGWAGSVRAKSANPRHRISGAMRIVSVANPGHQGFSTSHPRHPAKGSHCIDSRQETSCLVLRSGRQASTMLSGSMIYRRMTLCRELHVLGSTHNGASANLAAAYCNRLKVT